MAKVKDFLIGVQELVWTAVESGARDLDTIYAYVFMYEPRADLETVRNVLEDMLNDSEAELLWA